VIIARRTRSFLPSTSAGSSGGEEEGRDSEVVISRSWALLTRSGAPSQMGRARKIAGDLPTWDPLPPGEQVVRRTATAGKRSS